LPLFYRSAFLGVLSDELPVWQSSSSIRQQTMKSQRNSITDLLTAKLELSPADAAPEARYQFERLACFCVDGQESRPGHPIFNRMSTLEDTWVKEA